MLYLCVICVGDGDKRCGDDGCDGGRDDDRGGDEFTKYIHLKVLRLLLLLLLLIVGDEYHEYLFSWLATRKQRLFSALCSLVF